MLELSFEVHDEVGLGDLAVVGGVGGLVVEELVDFAHLYFGGLELGFEHAVFDVEFVVFLFESTIIPEL